MTASRPRAGRPLIAFLLFAAALFAAGPAEASRTTADAHPNLVPSSSLELPPPGPVAPIDSVESSPRFGFSEDLGLLDPEAGHAGFVVFAREAAQCELTYARNNPLNVVDPDGRDGVKVAEWLNRVADTIVDWGGTHDGGHYSSYVNVANRINRVADWLRVGSSTGDAVGSGADFHDTGMAFATDLGRASEMAFALGTAAEMVGPGGTQPQRSPTVQENKAKGDAFRDKVAADLRARGREVATEVRKPTPFGPRVIDVEVRAKGKPLGGIETKTGASPHTPSQRAKDEYLRRTGYPVTVVRDN